jgi:hypothetical protein
VTSQPPRIPSQHIPLFDEKLVDALQVAEMLVRNPESLSETPPCFIIV